MCAPITSPQHDSTLGEKMQFECPGKITADQVAHPFSNTVL